MTERAQEMNHLLVQQATLTRAMKHGYVLSPDENAANLSRAERLGELVELLGAHKYEMMPGGGVHSPGSYINERIRQWLNANPLPLSMGRVLDIITPPALYTLEGGVSVVVGDLQKGGYMYRVMEDDFAWSGARVEGVCSHQPPHAPAKDGGDAECDDQVVRGDMVLRVPEGVAEHFRQQGRRQLQREFASMMALESFR